MSNENEIYQYATIDPILPKDIIVNGFSIKKTIIEVLNQYGPEIYIGDLIDEIAEDIEEAFAKKLHLKQD